MVTRKELHKSKLPTSWDKVLSRNGIVHATTYVLDSRTDTYVHVITCDHHYLAESGYFKKTYKGDPVSCAACIALLETAEKSTK